MPTVNLAPVGVHLDDSVTRRLLTGDLLRGDTYLATGYFNLTDANMAALTAGRRRPVAVLCAHPTANGFLRARDLSGYIPAAYTYLLQRFHRALGRQSDVTLHEYQRPGWTFHSKGLWCHAAGEDTPSATVIGSSNFGYRSTYRDLESQVVMVTRHEPLRLALAEERRKLFLHSTPVDGSTFARPDRLVPLWVRFVSRLIRHFF
ncbi:CDP-diacylglycerol--glycerol-3-phosphate 3-phosphatidyltransferase, mitochondrial-like [Pollicipes pollicipes]|uniref:CDP-diacylglycerol--glycerol-3-phosphate 3-phosphatidyltransferase, mitochondrial-like n=1 Tax=Pollicipes pollicipes TaxID=41117 RepID=UPI00188513C0|nr:CDP-diacylglycerol--glycerol-3-phosphate 3-phosphatidyltransferase, mitochondrial-like [Pollicipes pollicipes]